MFSLYSHASLLSSWWRYFNRTAFRPFPRKPLCRWAQESSSNCSVALANCPRTYQQICHQVPLRVSFGSSPKKLMYTTYVILLKAGPLDIDLNILHLSAYWILSPPGLWNRYCYTPNLEMSEGALRSKVTPEEHTDGGGGKTQTLASCSRVLCDYDAVQFHNEYFIFGMQLIWISFGPGALPWTNLDNHSIREIALAIESERQKWSKPSYSRHSVILCPLFYFLIPFVFLHDEKHWFSIRLPSRSQRMTNRVNGGILDPTEHDWHPQEGRD